MRARSFNWDAFECLDHGAVESGDVGRFAARNQACLAHYLLIHPLATCVDDVGLQRGPGGDCSAFHNTGFHQQPGPVTDCGDGFMGVEEGSRKVDSLRVRAQVIGIHNAAG